MPWLEKLAFGFLLFGLFCWLTATTKAIRIAEKKLVFNSTLKKKIVIRIIVGAILIIFASLILLKKHFF